MKKFLTVFFALVMSMSCLFGLVGCGSDKQTLQVYTNAGFAPYEYVNTNGEVVGVDIDIMQEIGEILGYEVVINDIDFDQIFVEIEKNEWAIGAAGITQRNDRDDIALASIPYAVSVQYVIVPAGEFTSDKITVAELANLKNKAIGVQSGTTGNFLIEDAINGTTNKDGEHVKGDLEGKNNSVVIYDNAIIASQDIGTMVGAVVIDKLPAQTIAAGSNGKLVAIELDSAPEEYVLYCNKNATELVGKINKVLETMINGGVIDFYTLKHSGGIIGK